MLNVTGGYINSSSQEQDNKLVAYVQVVLVGGFGKGNCYCLKDK